MILARLERIEQQLALVVDLLSGSTELPLTADQVAMDRLADRLKRERLLHGWTQADAAREMGVTTRAYQSWETAESLPKPHRLAAVARVLDTSIGDLIGSSENGAGDLEEVA